jgi:hypothetical protein
MSLCSFGLLWPLTVRSQFWPFTDVLRQIWPAVTRKMEIFLNRRKPRQRSIRLDCARRKTVFVFFVVFCQSRLAKSLRRDRKTNPPADFSPAGGNLFNVSSCGLGRHPEGRADHWGQGCRPIVLAPWPPLKPEKPPLEPAPRNLLPRSVKQFQVAPGSTTAARICAANAAGTVMVTRALTLLPLLFRSSVIELDRFSEHLGAAKKV